MTREGNEAENAVRLVLIADAGIQTATGGAGEERVYSAAWPRELATWPSILIQSIGAPSRIEQPPFVDELFQISIYGNERGGDDDDDSSTVREIAQLVRAALQWGNPLGLQPPLLACTSLSVRPGFDPDTNQPIQHVDALLLVDCVAEGVPA